MLKAGLLVLRLRFGFGLGLGLGWWGWVVDVVDDGGGGGGLLLLLLVREYDCDWARAWSVCERVCGLLGKVEDLGEAAPPLVVVVVVVVVVDEDCVDKGRSVVAVVRLVMAADFARVWPTCRGGGLGAAAAVGEGAPDVLNRPELFASPPIEAPDVLRAVVIGGGTLRVEGALPNGLAVAVVVVAVVVPPFSPLVVGLVRRPPVAVLPENTPESGLLVPVVELDARLLLPTADEEDAEAVAAELVADRVRGFTGSRLGDVFLGALRAGFASAPL